MGRTAVSLLSGGKDSLYALWIAEMHSFDVLYTASITENSDMYHQLNLWVVKEVSRSLGKEHVEGTLEKVLELPVEWVITGAVASDYQRFHFVWSAWKKGKKVYSPLWHLHPEKYIRMLVGDGFTFLIVYAGTEGMKEWLGRVVDRDNVEDFLLTLRKENAHPAGEGGEYESLVLESPYHTMDVKGRIEGRSYVVEEVRLRL